MCVATQPFRSHMQRTERAEAFVFTKPHANTKMVVECVRKRFTEVGVDVLCEGDIDGPTIDAKKLIDYHYYAIASKATLLKPSQLNPPKDRWNDTDSNPLRSVEGGPLRSTVLGLCARICRLTPRRP